MKMFLRIYPLDLMLLKNHFITKSNCGNEKKAVKFDAVEEPFFIDTSIKKNVWPVRFYAVEGPFLQKRNCYK